MMDKELLDGLKNFDEVWKRVQNSKTAETGKAATSALMPRKNAKRSGQRFSPPKL